MTEARINHVLQFFYPTIVFLTLVLSWNTVGQAGGFGDNKIADFNFEPRNNQPTPIQLSCSQDGSNSKLNQSCKPGVGTPWTLLDADDLTPGSNEQTSYFTAGPDSRNDDRPFSQDNGSSLEREAL
jgi:hypothetical protein